MNIMLSNLPHAHANELSANPLVSNPEVDCEYQTCHTRFGLDDLMTSDNRSTFFVTANQTLTCIWQNKLR